jgi:hypothetical protein
MPVTGPIGVDMRILSMDGMSARRSLRSLEPDCRNRSRFVMATVPVGILPFPSHHNHVLENMQWLPWSMCRSRLGVEGEYPAARCRHAGVYARQRGPT